MALTLSPGNKPDIPRTHAAICRFFIRCVCRTLLQHESKNARRYSVTVRVRAMLSVSFDLAMVVAMLLSIITSVFNIELDSLNDPTT